MWILDNKWHFLDVCSKKCENQSQSAVSISATSLTPPNADASFDLRVIYHHFSSFIRFLLCTLLSVIGELGHGRDTTDFCCSRV